jgi:predicted metalloprotease with PDZ domain
MQYTLSFSNPLSHFLSIQLEVKNLDAKELIFQLPSWRPGRYEIQNFAKNVRCFHAKSRESDPLEWVKISKDAWKVKTNGSQAVMVYYEYFAFQMDAGNSWLDEEQVYVNFINCLMYIPGREMQECTVALNVPKSYTIACGLKKLQPHLLFAPNFYVLVDSPMIASEHLHHGTYTCAGVEFHVWIKGNVPSHWEEMLEAFEKFSAYQIKSMGSFPCHDYHFLFQILPYTHYHGVEHFNSTVITLGPDTDWSLPKMQKNLLGISSHELFHTWNVIRMRPRELMPYQFDRAVYFDSGWMAEGLTTYYGDLFLVRSGVYSVKDFFDEINKWLVRHFENPGKTNSSLSTSSMELWLDGYVPGVPGRKVSIYIEGAIISLILDWRIRRETHQQKSLDDFVRMLWAHYLESGDGYSNDLAQHLLETLTGNNYEAFFATYIYGMGGREKELAQESNVFGCRLVLKNSSKRNEQKFGFRILEVLGEWKVTALAEGSPAEILLSIGDVVEKVDGQIPDSTLWDNLATDTITLEINRQGKKREVHLNAGERHYFSVFQLEQASDASAEQLENLKRWVEG